MRKSDLRVTSYQEARKLAESKNRTGVVCHNTTVRMEGDRVIFRLHATDIVVWEPGELLPSEKEPGYEVKGERVILFTNGYRTATTKDRMNRLIPLGWSVSQENGEWFLHYYEFDPYKNSKVKFHDGIVIEL